MLELRKEGLTSSQIAKREKCSQRTVFRILANNEVT
ncbi:MAG: helix-turn-helix domain-containing protein [Desulfobulbia bacterium]